MLIRNRKPKAKGFIGPCVLTNKAPYFQTERSASFYPLGEDSNFITPKDSEKLANTSNGIKR